MCKPEQGLRFRYITQLLLGQQIGIIGWLMETTQPSECFRKRYSLPEQKEEEYVANHKNRFEKVLRACMQCILVVGI